jgi:hypothetical protein
MNVKKFKNEMTTFWETMLTKHKKGKISNKSVRENCAKYGLDPVPEPQTELSQSRNRNRYQSLRFHITVARS